MKYIISGTDRPQSNSLSVSKFIQSLFLEAGEKTEIIDLADLKISHMQGPFYGKELPAFLGQEIEKIKNCDGLLIVCPEYNGSMPGILKYFIDHWKYPESFEFRPVAFVGLGGMFGGLRPVEHLQQVFNYRNAFVYPERIFLQNVWKILGSDDQIQDPVILDLMKKQVKGFQLFCTALQGAHLDARSRLQNKNN